MLSATDTSTQKLFVRRGFVRAVILLAVSVLSFGALALPIAIRPSSFPVRIRDVAAQDIEAPQALTFQSEFLTEQARLQAQHNIGPVYLPADPAIARRQIEELHVALSYITTVRLDTYATLDQKIQDLAAIKNLPLTSDLSKRVLALTDARWQIIQNETLSVLEQTMRNTIREDQLDVGRRNISTLISYSLPEDQARIVSDLASPYVQPNSLYSEEQTRLEQEKARQAVEPISRSFASGETIVRRGQIITPETWEVLEKFGLVQPPKEYPDLIAAGALVVLVSAFIVLYLIRRNVPALESPRSLGSDRSYICVFSLPRPGCRYQTAPSFPISTRWPAFGLTIACTVHPRAWASSVIGAEYPGGVWVDQQPGPDTLLHTFQFGCAVLILGKGLRSGSFFSAGISGGCSRRGCGACLPPAGSYGRLVGITTLTLAGFV